MDNTSLHGLHWPENKRRRRRANLTRRVICHSSQFRLARRAIIVRVTNDSLSLGKRTAKGLIQNLLQSIQQFAALPQEQPAIVAFNSQQTTEFGLRSFRAQIKTCACKNRIQELFSSCASLV